MIVDDLDALGSIGSPAEADAILFVDPDTVLPGAFSGEGFEPIARGRTQVVESPGAIELRKLALRDAPQVNGKGRRAAFESVPSYASAVPASANFTSPL